MNSGTSFPWLPVNFPIGDGFAVRRVIGSVPADGAQVYQLLDSQSGDDFCVLIKTEKCTRQTQSAIKAMSGINFFGVCRGAHQFTAAIFSSADKPYRLTDVFSRQTLLQNPEAKELSCALAKIANHSWLQSLYLPLARAFLPFGKPEGADDRRLLVAKMLTAGDADSPLSPKQIHATNNWLTIGEIKEIFGALSIIQPEVTRTRPIVAKSDFVLPGQPELEKFFREEIVDYHRNYDKNRAMGVNPVGGVLLYGKPGSGKTFAVRALADFLGWPVFDISIGQVGSKFIHDTSVKLRNQFEKAVKQAPSIVFMDEIDAIGGKRDAGNQDHKIEEISELLRMVETAVKEGVFVVAATNRPEALDPALKRTGRFDHHIEVKYPDAGAMEKILHNCLSMRPHSAGINLRPFADILAGKQASEAELIVNIAAKTAVRCDKTEIDETCLSQAVRERYPHFVV